MTNPERFYFTSSGAPAITPAFGSIWDVTGTAIRAVTYQHRAGTSMVNSGVTETDSGIVDGLIAQLVCDDPLAAGEVPLANFTIASRMYESDLGADAYLQAMIRVVSSDGLTERGVLYSGQSFTSVSTNPADPNYELEQLGQEVRVLTGTFSSVIAQEDDRVVIELGVRFCNATASGKNAVITLGDQSTFPGGTDVAAIVDDPGSGVVSWIEFDREVMPRRRFYFTSSGVPATSPAFGSQWEDTDDAVRLPLLDLGGTTALTQFNTDNAAGVTDVLAFQFISEDPLPGGPVDPGTFALITKAVDDQGSDAYMQAVIRVVSGDGLTERGVLYSGQTFTVTSPTSTDPNYGYTNSTGLTNPRSRRVLGSCTPLVAEPGDRLVVELGSRDCELAAGSHVQGLTTGSTSIVDWGIDSINNTNIDRPWIEFTRSPFIETLPRVPINLQTTPSSTTILLEWDPATGGPAATGFRVRIDGGAPIDVGLDLDHLFESLTPETEYLLEVQAYNAEGDSEWVSTMETTTASLGGSFVTGVISTCPSATVQWAVSPISLDVNVMTGAVNSAGTAVLAQDAPVLLTGPTVLVWNNPGLTDYRPALFVECPGIEITAVSSTCFESVPVDGTDCYDEYLRTLHSVTTINGPAVTAKMPLSTGAEVWSAQFTSVAANPDQFGANFPLIEGFLNPGVGDPYVGGLPEGATYDEAGFIQDEPDCPVPSYSPIYDPLCPAIIPPPPVPNVSLACYTFPPNYVRRFFTVPAQEVPQWGEVIPVFSISAPNGEVRNLRLRFHADITGGGEPDIDPCDYIAEAVFSYIPDGGTIVFDGTDQLVYVEDSEGRRRADSLVFSTDGSPFEWPVLTCGYGYVVYVDLPQIGNLPVIDMALVARVR